MSLSKITRNFQVTIPRDIREINDFHVGDKIIFMMDGERVEITKAKKDTIRAAAGLWSDIKETGVEYERRLRKVWGKRRVE